MEREKKEWEDEADLPEQKKLVGHEGQDGRADIARAGIHALEAGGNCPQEAVHWEEEPRY